MVHSQPEPFEAEHYLQVLHWILRVVRFENIALEFSGQCVVCYGIMGTEVINCVEF